MHHASRPHDRTAPGRHRTDHLGLYRQLATRGLEQRGIHGASGFLTRWQRQPLGGERGHPLGFGNRLDIDQAAAGKGQDPGKAPGIQTVVPLLD